MVGEASRGGQVAATAEEGSFTQAAAELAVKNYAYRADLAARKAAENAKYMANAKASGPTKERLNSSVAASNARYTVEQAEFFRKRATKAMAESKQFADQAAQAQLLTKTIYDGPEQAVKEACENNVAALLRHSSEVAQANGVSAAEFTVDVQCVEVTPWFDKQWGRIGGNWILHCCLMRRFQ